MRSADLKKIHRVAAALPLERGKALRKGIFQHVSDENFLLRLDQKLQPVDLFFGITSIIFNRKLYPDD
jgi:hypothetical protein